MSRSNSECSSGCESGWTMYLDQSSNYAEQFQKSGGRIVSGDCRYKAANVEEEDLSMVSDASSGPPHFQEDEDCFDEAGNYSQGNSDSEQASKREKKKKIKEQRGKKQHLCLDDTASSPTLSFSKKHVSLPPSGGGSMKQGSGFSATQLKGKSALKKHFGFFQSSVSGKPAS